MLAESYQNSRPDPQPHPAAHGASTMLEQLRTPAGPGGCHRGGQRARFLYRPAHRSVHRQRAWPGPGELPCIGVSTLEAMAWNLAHVDGVICCAMDARRKQVYNALFEAKDGQLTRLTPDRAISLEELFHGETVEKETANSSWRWGGTVL